MSDENKQNIERMYAAFAKAGVPYIIGALDPQVEWWEAENFIYADKDGSPIGVQGIGRLIAGNVPMMSPSPSREVRS